MQIDELGESLAEDFRQELENFSEDLAPDLKAQLERSATRIAAYVELSLRNPDIAERLQWAIKMEKGRMEVIGSRAAWDANKRFRDLAFKATTKIIEALL